MSLSRAPHPRKTKKELTELRSLSEGLYVKVASKTDGGDAELARRVESEDDFGAILKVNGQLCTICNKLFVLQAFPFSTRDPVTSFWNPDFFNIGFGMTAPSLLLF